MSENTANLAAELDAMQDAREKQGQRDTIYGMLAGHIGRQLNTSSPVMRHIDPRDKISLPEGMDLAKGARALMQEQRAMEEETDYHKQFEAKVYDGLVAVHNVLERAFGSVGRGVRQESFFGSNPPAKMSVTIGVDEYGRPITKEVAASEISHEILEMHLDFGTWANSEHDDLFRLKITAKVRAGDAIAGLFQMIEDELRENSIYRGKMLQYRSNPEGGYELRHILRREDPTIVYSDEVQVQLQDDILGVIRNRDQLIKAGHLGIFKGLLWGPLGTGKSAAMVTVATEAVNAGMTVIEYQPSGSDSLKDLERVFNVAKMYGPSVVLIEDFDKFFTADYNENSRSVLTNLIDGADKHNGISVLMTTNNLEKIDSAMTRAQRLTSQIEIGALDRDGVEHMLKVVLGHQLSDDVDFDEVYEVVADYHPAFIRSTFDKASQVSIIRTGKIGEKLTTEDLVRAARSKKAQHELHKEVNEKQNAKKSILEQIADLTGQGISQWVRKSFRLHEAGRGAHLDIVER